MKRLFFFAAIAAIILAGCSLGGATNGGPHGSGALPAHVSISNARGLFLQSGTSKAAFTIARSAMGRSVVSAPSSTLGAISSSGIPETATFTDSTGSAVTVTITQGVQLTSQYVLLAYTYSGGSGLGSLDMTSGNLAPVTVTPDNWANIFATGSTAWYESGGGIYSLNLSTGAVVSISSSSPVYGNNGTGQLYGAGNQPDPQIASSASWNSSAWPYVDSAGNVYVLDMSGSGYFQAACIPAGGGAQIDFGSNALAYFFTLWLPTNGSVEGANYLAAVDSTTGNLYLVLSHDEWNGNPESWGGSTITGVAFQVYQVTMGPAITSNNGAVMSFAPGSPAAAIALTSTFFPMTYVGFGRSLQSAVFTKGAETLAVSLSGNSTTITDYNTSSVPVSGEGTVTNWRWSGGHAYAGPVTNQTINLVKFSGSTGTAAQLLSNPKPITSWSVVGGVLFYSDSTGSYQATVNTASATISTPQPYSGGQVAAITQ